MAEAFGALFGGASALASQYLSYKYAKALQKQQYKLNTKALQNYYTNHRLSLEKADYNPLLNVPGSSAQGFSASSSGVPSDIGSGMEAGVNSALAIKKSRADIENTNADTDVKKYGKVGAIIKNLFKLRKDPDIKNNPVAKKMVSSAIVGQSSESNSVGNYISDHPTQYNFARKLLKRDFKGAGYVVGQRLSQKINSAKSYDYNSKKFKELTDSEVYKHDNSRKLSKRSYNKPPKVHPY